MPHWTFGTAPFLNLKSEYKNATINKYSYLFADKRQWQTSDINPPVTPWRLTYLANRQPEFSSDPRITTKLGRNLDIN